METTMNVLINRNVLVAAIVLVLSATAWPVLESAAHAAELNLRPIKATPQPLTRLHPKLKWMTEQKVRMIWIGDDLFEKYADSDKTKGQVIVDAGFNLVRVTMGVNSDDKPSGVVDTSKPLELRHDRSKSTALETRLAPNVAEARRVGIPLMVGWQYGTHHLEPYRKYRTAKGELHKITCCPLDEDYIAGQHVGKWAVKLAEGGADGMLIDMEMYHSDTAWFRGPCTCDDCFEMYLKRFGRSWRTTYKNVPAESRGTWLADQKATEHYAAFAAKRVEAMYDSIRRKCQAINPVFFFGIAPQLNHLRGVERGLGTRSVPCLAFGEHEYTHGAYRGSFMCTKQCRQSLPALYVSGASIFRQPPEMLANNVIQSSLYTNGWWAYYGTALLINVGPGAEKKVLPGGYGRWGQTSAADYLDRITAAHAKLDELLKLPKEQWPPREDGKLNWLKKRVAEAKDDKARAEIQADLTRYEGYVAQGGY